MSETDVMMTNEEWPPRRRILFYWQATRPLSPEPQFGDPDRARRTVFDLPNKRQRVNRELKVTIREAYFAAMVSGEEVDPTVLMETFGLTEHNAKKILDDMRSDARLVPAAHQNGNHSA